MVNDDIETAFVKLIVSNQAALRAYINSLMPGDSEVKDVIQDANTVIWEKRGEFTVGTNFRSWMFKIAKFKVLSHWRDRKRKQVWTFSPETLEQIIDQMENLKFEGISRKEEMLEQCLGQLRPEDRSMILNRYSPEHGIKELATEAGRTVESLRVSLHRIRSTLRNCIRRKVREAEMTS